MVRRGPFCCKTDYLSGREPFRVLSVEDASPFLKVQAPMKRVHSKRLGKVATCSSSLTIKKLNEGEWSLIFSMETIAIYV